MASLVAMLSKLSHAFNGSISILAQAWQGWLTMTIITHRNGLAYYWILDVQFNGVLRISAKDSLLRDAIGDDNPGSLEARISRVDE
ncbi:hypothetical protein ABKN59_002350 [Abortiporus biennis]